MAQRVRPAGVADTVALSSTQQDFAGFRQGSAILHAPVGTGKTLALAERVAEALRRGEDPDRILCLTFTNRAAAEMRERVALHCGPDSQRVHMLTFRDLCARMLRVEAQVLGLPSDFVIFDEVDATELMARILQESRDEVVIGQRCREIYDTIERCKANAPSSALPPCLSSSKVFAGLRRNDYALAVAYQRELANCHALDFADLVLWARMMLDCVPEVNDRWSHRFSMVQVDEMQDMHVSEYLVLRSLATRSASVVLAGDSAQTIHEWRGSAPEVVLQRFAADFPVPVTFTFDVNYRATKTLIGVAAAVARSFSVCAPSVAAPAACAGDPVVVHFARDGASEARWVVQQIRAVHQATGTPLGRVGVLVRTKQRGEVLSQALAAQGVAHVTVEQYDFFRRQEVKDVLAYLRFLLNPHDGHSLQRMLLRPARGAGVGALARVRAAGNTGLRLVDLVNSPGRGDPFGPLLSAYESGAITVFATRATGPNPAHDEIAELAAVRLEGGQEVGRLHTYVRNTVSVGDSTAAHGLSDAVLAARGVPLAAALEGFWHLSAGSILVGHNVSLDLRMLHANSRRVRIGVGKLVHADTLEIAHRFVRLERYTLQALAEYFGMASQPSHHALADTLATCSLLSHLIPLARAYSSTRARLCSELAPFWRPLAHEVAVLRERMAFRRPAQLMAEVLRESGLLEYYDEEQRRVANIEELYRICRRHDNPTVDPIAALESFVSYASLAGSVDRLDSSDQRVRVLTVHQAKGLEFDVVFVCGLSENEFPGYLSIKAGEEKEEQRLLYVAVSRARNQLCLTGHASHMGKQRRPSPFFRLIGDDWVELGSQSVTSFVDASKGA